MLDEPNSSRYKRGQEGADLPREGVSALASTLPDNEQQRSTTKGSPST